MKNKHIGSDFEHTIKDLIAIIDNQEYLAVVEGDLASVYDESNIPYGN